jgi:[acyl-carrier-protein] S-malonyltransferase
MGRSLAEVFPTVRDVFAEADGVLGDHLSDICFEGPEAVLTETVNTQPAILTVSVAVARLLEEAGVLLPVVAAGHSLGEYSALVAAEVLSFADALLLVRMRGSAMQAAVPPGLGGMAAIIGLDREDVAALCSQVDNRADRVLQMANLNASDQVVVAGHMECVDAVLEAAESAGARRAVPLAVSGPFHCRLMKPAGQELSKALAPVALRNFRFPVIANVTAEPVSEPHRVKELLIRQVASPVRWVDTMDALVAAGIEAAVEVGPGRVLSGLLRRHARGIKTYNVEDPASLEKTLAALGA